jgi:hypothetical protein
MSGQAGIREETMKTTTLAVAAFLLAAVAAAQQSVPPYVNYQGRLTDASGNPLATGDYALKFTVWDSATGGTQVWGPLWFDRAAGQVLSNGHKYRVPVIQGYFNVMLGEVDDASRSVLTAFNDASRYVQVEITAGPPGFTPSGGPISPRQQVLSTPYAIRTGALSAVAGSPGAVRIAGSAPELQIMDTDDNSNANPRKQGGSIYWMDHAGYPAATVGFPNGDTNLDIKNSIGPLRLFGKNLTSSLVLSDTISSSSNFVLTGDLSAHNLTATGTGKVIFSSVTSPSPVQTRSQSEQCGPFVTASFCALRSVQQRNFIDSGTWAYCTIRYAGRSWQVCARGNDHTEVFCEMTCF